VYLAHDAARLAGVPGDRIGQWARWGHIAASVSAGDPHVYAWEDVAEALAVHELLERGVRLPVIRAAVERLGGAAAHPLAAAGPTAVGLLPLNGDPAAAELLRRGGWPSLRLGLRHVEVDPARMGGRPCVRGTRIPVEDVAAAPGADWGLTAEQVDEAVRWWEEAERCAS
jgi:uncharacterized protein (DUF433 family)